MSSIFNFVESSLIYTMWMTAAVCSTYSASMLNRLIDCCFDDFHETGSSFEKTRYSWIDQLSLISSVRSSSFRFWKNFRSWLIDRTRHLDSSFFLDIEELVSRWFSVHWLNCSWIELALKRRMRYQSVFESLNASDSRSELDKSLNQRSNNDDLLMLWRD